MENGANFSRQFTNGYFERGKSLKGLGQHAVTLSEAISNRSTQSTIEPSSKASLAGLIPSLRIRSRSRSPEKTWTHSVRRLKRPTRSQAIQTNEYNKQAHRILQMSLVLPELNDRWAACRCLVGFWLPSCTPTVVETAMAYVTRAGSRAERAKGIRLLRHACANSAALKRFIMFKVSSRQVVERLIACHVLGRLPIPKTVAMKMLTLMLEDPSALVRDAAALSLRRESCLNAVIDVLGQWLIRDGARPKARALRCISRYGFISFRHMPAIRQCLKHESPAVREAACIVMAAMGKYDREAVKMLSKLAYGDVDGRVQQQAAEAMRSLGARDELHIMT